jgi:hypothetical protein
MLRPGHHRRFAEYRTTYSVAHSLVLMLLVQLGAAPLVKAVSFHVPEAYLAGNGGGAAVADFNGDGKPDVAAANSNSNTISILLGNGDGSLQPPVNYIVGNGPSGIAVGDFNGDGKLDLAVSINDPNTDGALSILLGNGDGTFRPGTTIQLSGSGAGQLVVADFNGDGKLDLAVTKLCCSVVVLAGNGDGTFGPGMSYQVGSYLTGLAVSDFNGDGKPDLAVSVGSEPVTKGGLVIWLNQGDGTFRKDASYHVGESPNGLAVADFNGDGASDLAVITSVGTNAALGIMLGNGDGTFQPPVYYFAVGAYPTSIAVGDFNGDGKPDLVVTGGYAAVAILLNRGDGTFKLDHYYYPGGLLIVADMNGDGNADLVLSGSSVIIMLGGGNGTFQHVLHYSLGSRHSLPSPSSVAVADLNGDGKPDLAVTSTDDSAVLIMLGNGDGTFQSPVAYAASVSAGSVAVGDFNRDGKLDLVVVGTSLSILFGNGDGTFQPAVSIGTGGAVVVAADFNRDGKLDLAVSGLVADTVSILLGKDNGTFQTPVSYTVGSDPGPIAVGDFSADGNLDLAVVNERANNVSILLGAGDGTFGPAVNYSVGTEPVSIAVGNFTGHGKRDLAVANFGSPFASSTVSILLCNGDGTFQPAVNYDVGVGSQAVVAADFRGRGKIDVAVTGAYSEVVSILGGNGDGTFRSPVSYAAGPYPDSLGVGDFNGDGKQDLAVASDNNLLFVLLNNTP